MNEPEIADLQIVISQIKVDLLVLARMTERIADDVKALRAQFEAHRRRLSQEYE